MAKLDERPARKLTSRECANLLALLRSTARRGVSMDNDRIPETPLEAMKFLQRVRLYVDGQLHCLCSRARPDRGMIFPVVRALHCEISEHSALMVRLWELMEAISLEANIDPPWAIDLTPGGATWRRRGHDR